MTTSLSRRDFLAASIIPAAAGASALAHPAVLLNAVADASRPATVPDEDWRDAGIIEVSKSPYAKLKTVPAHAVTIQDGLWQNRRQTSVNSSIPSMHDKLIEHGRMDNFLRLQGKSDAPQRGPVYSDSDIYKWLEAVGFSLQTGSQAQLQATADAMIREVVAAQEPSGYLNTYFVGDRRSLRMLPATQETGHELYCIGHLLQASIAWYRANGDATLLKAGIRFVDNFLLPNYGPAPNQKPIVAGHPEIEMSLIELYRTTGNRRYLELAGYILRGDSRIPLTPRQTTYMFCGIPFTSRTKLEGHAVRAMYACCGATDYYLETGDPEYWKTLNVLWDDLSRHQIYITGGVGARAGGEAFGDAFELPNARAYGESCAAIGNMMWNWRMLAATGDAKFTDVMERALYNGINSGMSLDGRTYCYRNPLAFDPSTGDRIRNPWYDTDCCPPNLERTFASLPGYFYSTSSEGIYVHLYHNSELNWRLPDGSGLSIVQKTRYPWEGEVLLEVSPAGPADFPLNVRIPAWSAQNTVRVNGKAVAGAEAAGQYLQIRRRWSKGDRVALSFDMTPQILRANPAVTENTGRVALQRGPVVFCMEGLDQTIRPEERNFAGYSVRASGATSASWDASLLDGVIVLQHQGSHEDGPPSPALYYAASTPQPAFTEATLRLIPYYAWANRAPSEMQVWIPYIRA
ncbi:MAG TPA: beta-L-arabinofuranosidase domain-containing protein [Terriglobia bacterium]|nr:beta-L-arabinofuranosidase domain-containing protein [Terriglobia bacterium]